MMADEAPQMDAFSAEHYGGSPASLFVCTSECDAQGEQAVAGGVRRHREPADQPYGDRMADVKDPFG
jgi:PhnB protein